MNNSGLKDQRIQPLSESDLPEVENLFLTYPYKDFQLRHMDIPKEKMAKFLKKSLKSRTARSACLRENDKLVGLISAVHLPWISDLFGANLYHLQHLLTDGKGAGYYQNILRYFMDQIEDVDFIGCRVASGDVNAVQALEDSGFRFVGNEVYLVNSLSRAPLPEEYGDTDCGPCPEHLRRQVMELVEKTHVHNRYMYDPEVQPEKAAEIFSRYISGFGFQKNFRHLIKMREGRVVGFIFYKFNNALSEVAGGKYASLDFIGVDKQARNAGVGDELNRAALYDLAAQGTTHVAARTFGSNYPAIRILHKVGFIITSSDLHFHLWLRSAAQVKNRVLDRIDPGI